MIDIFLAYDSSDEYWRIRFDDVFGQDFNCRLISPGEMESETGEDFIRWILEQDLLTEDTVMVALIGPKTFASKKMDWELAAALEKKGRRPTGIVPTRLPNHDDYQKKSVNPRRIPGRLADNLKSGYVKIYDWTESPKELEKRIYTALKEARSLGMKASNSRKLMARDMFL